MKFSYNEFEVCKELINNNDDPRICSFFLTNMRHNETFEADLKSFIKVRYGILANFIFEYQGSTIQMHWTEKDVYEYFKEYKYSRNKNGVPKNVATTARVPLGEKRVNGTETYKEIDEIGQNFHQHNTQLRRFRYVFDLLF